MKPAFIFTDNMVLQAEKPIKVFGEGETEVTVELNGVSAKAETKNGKWCAVLPETNPGGPYELTISDKAKSVTYKNVMIGEVFVAAGQSNMEQPTFDTLGGFRFAESNENPMIRLFTVPRRTRKDALQYTWHFESVYSEDTPWSECNMDAALHFSGVGLYFASCLQKKLGCAVGIISCNQGASRIESWMDENLLVGTDICTKLFEDCKNSIATTAPEEYAKIYDDFKEKINTACKEADAFAIAKTDLISVAKDQVIKRPAPIPFGNRHIHWPGVLYHNMIERFVPYAVRGILWYQGESNCVNAEKYFDAFQLLTENWRNLWKENLPFLTVKISEFGGGGPKWHIVQECQERAARELENVYIVQSADIGEDDNIHPINKRPIGERLCTVALEEIYGV